MDDRGAGSGPPAALSHERAPTTFVVSPHLLVAQAVAAALGSLGLPVRAAPWEAAFGTTAAASVRRVVVVVDDTQDVGVLTQINDSIQARDLRVAVVAADPTAPRWGVVLETDAVEVVPLTSSPDELADVVGRFVAGEALMAPDERHRLRAAWSQDLERRRDLALRVGMLSPQQLRVLEMLAEGRRVSEVAESIGVTPATVRSHIKSLRAKLGASTQLEAVAMLRQAGLDDAADLVPRPRSGTADAPRPVAPR